MTRNELLRACSSDDLILPWLQDDYIFSPLCACASPLKPTFCRWEMSGEEESLAGNPRAIYYLLLSFKKVLRDLPRKKIYQAPHANNYDDYDHCSDDTYGGSISWLGLLLLIV